MNARLIYLLIGVVIIAIGVMAIFGHLNLINHSDNLIGGTLLLVGAYLLFLNYQSNLSRKILLLPIAIMATAGMGVLVEPFAPIVKNLFGALFFFALFGGFAYLFKRQEKYWWAVIPAGFSFTLGAIALVEALELLDNDYSGFIFLTGAGLTFLYLWGLERGDQIFPWAIWPAGIFFLLALFALSEAAPWFSHKLLLSILLISGGSILIRNHWRKRR